jgi:hypothetical protein
MQVLYRVSSNSYKKEKLTYASKEYCLNNFIDNVLDSTDKMTIIADCVNEELRDFIDRCSTKNIEIMHKVLGSNGASFRFQIDLASTLPDDEIVLFQEDDYLYKPANWPYKINTSYNDLITEALEFADYISFYDHPDKYLPPKLGGNKFISDMGVENTGVFRTKTSHWKYTNSTTCTFATTAKVIKHDKNTWKTFCPESHPYDFQSFLALGIRGRTLATSIPGKSTHAEKHFLSPFFLADTGAT